MMKKVNLDFHMWAEGTSEEFRVTYEGRDFIVGAMNTCSPEDPDPEIEMVIEISPDGDETETNDYPERLIEEWLFNFYLRVEPLNPEELGWETNRFKETL